MQDKYLHTSAGSATWEDQPARRAWYHLLKVSREVLRELDARLTQEHRLSVNEFDVLITLDNAPGRRLRMSDLADAVMLSSGGLTRLVGRLEDRELVHRTPDEDDARGFHAVLTRAGATRLAQARRTHDAVIEELVAARLSDAQVQSLARALERLADA